MEKQRCNTRKKLKAILEWPEPKMCKNFEGSLDITDSTPDS